MLSAPIPLRNAAEFANSLQKVAKDSNSAELADSLHEVSEPVPLASCLHEQKQDDGWNQESEIEELNEKIDKVDEIDLIEDDKDIHVVEEQEVKEIEMISEAVTTGTSARS